MKYTAGGVGIFSGSSWVPMLSHAIFPTSLPCSHQHFFERENSDFQSYKERDYVMLSYLGFLGRADTSSFSNKLAQGCISIPEPLPVAGGWSALSGQAEPCPQS